MEFQGIFPVFVIRGRCLCVFSLIGGRKIPIFAFITLRRCRMAGSGIRPFILYRYGLMSENDARFGIINISSFMKSLLLSCLLIAGLSSACSPGVSNSAVSARYAERDSLLTALDRTVANKAVYIGLAARPD